MPKSKAPATKRPSLRHVKRAAGIDEPQNAVQLLKADHRKVESLFKTFKKADSTPAKESLAKQICEALKVHMRIEEEVFYPAFIEATGNEELHSEAVVEHSAAKRLIEEIESSAAGNALFDARVNVLSEMIKHHVKEEERFNGMFMKARMARMDLRALGILLEARQQELTRRPEKPGAKTPRGTRAAFMGAAALARSRGGKPHARRTP
jgi:hemerythrin superfamily protein